MYRDTVVTGANPGKTVLTVTIRASFDDRAETRKYIAQPGGRWETNLQNWHPAHTNASLIITADGWAPTFVTLWSAPGFKGDPVVYQPAWGCTEK